MTVNLVMYRLFSDRVFSEIGDTLRAIERISSTINSTVHTLISIFTTLTLHDAIAMVLDLRGLNHCNTFEELNFGNLCCNPLVRRAFRVPEEIRKDEDVPKVATDDMIFGAFESYREHRAEGKSEGEGVKEIYTRLLNPGVEHHLYSKNKKWTPLIYPFVCFMCQVINGLAVEKWI